ncbi:MULTISPECIES: condensation domain-containing protein [Streptacidiphilus]|uniref:Condensation domain-containing protein n=1 Tax=Streptacidiphilus cavernicola TaxID=3342716 RepID=A0ABV6UJ51_9ACTN|nr:condensation domain-containing protein [Streptacidiphilus jeojiense]
MTARVDAAAPVATARTCPVSFPQESLWPPSGLSAINVPAVLRFRGTFDVGHLYQVLGVLVGRHEALRTVLGRNADGVLAQRIAPTGSLPLEAARHRGTLEYVLPRLLLAGSERPFRLDGGPLARAELHGFGPQDHLLILWMHHAVSDLAASRVVVEEIKQLWAGAQPAPVRAQMADFAVRERAVRASAAQRDHWVSALRSADDLLGLPVATGTEHLALRPSLPLLPKEVLESLERLAARHRTTLTAVLAAAVVAAHTGGRADAGKVVLGLTMSNRELPRFRSTVGCLTDQLPLVVDAGGNPTFGQLLDRVREALLDAYDHRLPLGTLLPLLGRQRPPVFAVNLNFLPPSPPGTRPAGPYPPVLGSAGAAVPGEVEFPYGIVKTRPDPWWLGDAVLAYRPRIDGRGLGGEIEGDAALHSVDAVARHGQRFSALLAKVAWNPGATVGSLVVPRG